jgi:3'-5' exoribonuclease
VAVWGRELKEHPAAKAIHHAYRGGLLEHTVSMAEVALRVCELYDELDKDLVLLGVLFHDLGKLIEIGSMPVNEYSKPGRLVGHVVMGRDMLLERCRSIENFPDELRLHLEHLVLSHQGRLEYGSPVAPMTAEALTLHFIDNLDSKLAQLRNAVHAGGTGFQYVRGLDRFIYLGEPDGDPAADEESTEAPAQAHLEL